MMECRRISTFSRSATSCALRSGRTLKPMTTALEAEASRMSDSVMAPTPEWRTLTRTFSVDMRPSESASTSTEPCTSPLRMRLRSLTPACLICSARPSSETREDLASCASRSFILRYWAMPLALSRSAMTRKVSPASGMDSRPRISTGVEGPASLISRAAVVEHGADLAEGVADDVAVADLERAVLHEDGGDGAAAAIELGFDDGADGGTLGLGLLLVGVGDEADHFFEAVEVDALLGGDFDELDVAAHAGGLHAASGELLHDAWRDRLRACRSC